MFLSITLLYIPRNVYMSKCIYILIIFIFQFGISLLIMLLKFLKKFRGKWNIFQASAQCESMGGINGESRINGVVLD